MGRAQCLSLRPAPRILLVATGPCAPLATWRARCRHHEACQSPTPPTGLAEQSSRPPHRSPATAGGRRSQLRATLGHHYRDRDLTERLAAFASCPSNGAHLATLHTRGLYLIESDARFGPTPPPAAALPLSAAPLIRLMRLSPPEAKASAAQATPPPPLEPARARHRARRHSMTFRANGSCKCSLTTRVVAAGPARVSPSARPTLDQALTHKQAVPDTVASNPQNSFIFISALNSRPLVRRPLQLTWPESCGHRPDLIKEWALVLSAYSPTLPVGGAVRALAR